jgi:hypothetical protein
VPFEIVGAREGLEAEVADVGFVASVRTLVRPETARSREGLEVGFANVGLVASVRTLVRPECTGVREGLEAAVADVRFVRSCALRWLDCEKGLRQRSQT